MKELSVPKTRLRIFTLLLVAFLLCGSTTAVAASVSPSVQNSSTQMQIQALLKLLYQLQTQLIAMQSNANGSSIQGYAPEYSYKKISSLVDGPVGIDISSPLEGVTYDKSNPLTDTLEFIWKVTNVPEKGMSDIVIETERIQLYSYSGAVGGFTWSGELPVGDSTGIYKADISKQSAEGAGLYRARVKVRNCSFEKVNYCDDAHATFKVSKWVTYSIIDSRSSENEKSPLVELKTNGISTDTFQTSPYTNLDFTIHPSVGSKISNCSVNKTYTDGTRSEILKFNKIITADNYGKTSALAVTDLGALQNVSVSCRLNSKITLSDSVRLDVMQSPLKKKTELFMNNRSIGDFIDSTEIAMLKFCRDTMRILEAGSEKGLFQCYWGGESVIEAKVGYKG